MPQRRRNAWTTRLAMLGGLVLGLALLATMRPGSADPVAVHVDPPAAKMPAPELRATPRRPVTSPPLQPAAEPQEEDEDARVEPVDTGFFEEDLAQIEVHFEDADGYVVDDARGGLVGCEVQSFQRTEDGFIAEVVAGDICEARAFRRDGLLGVRADPLEFEAIHGLVATLVFPAERTGGIGVQFQAVEGGMLVKAVLPGTPAYMAGLSPGDLIVAVEGMDTAQLDEQGFVDEMTGPEGSDVEFEVEFEADTGLSRSSVTLTRAFLSG